METKKLNKKEDYSLYVFIPHFEEHRKKRDYKALFWSA